MGRRSYNSLNEKKPFYKNPDILKKRHRFSDTKYRHNVQFLYELLRDVANESCTKDTLLNTISRDMQKMHNDIVLVAGSLKLEKLNVQFLEIVEMGESIWKKNKNPAQWWDQMQMILKGFMD